VPNLSYLFSAGTGTKGPEFTTLKGWGTGVSHLASSASIPTQPTHITLDRQLPSDKAGGLVYHT